MVIPFHSPCCRNPRPKPAPASHLRTLSVLAAGALLSVATVQAAPLPDEHDLAKLSLEDLMRIEISSAARKQQALADTAAAVFVITREDIRRSGVTNIPDALRMAPGVSVARIDSSKWAITVRGFNGRFARKLLVLIDGRSVYTPLFSGVFWDVQDTLLEDIERIEVIRGPGATIWGANAVNGVINIITRNAHDTTGGLAVAGAGTYERGFGALRYGAPLGSWGAARVYGTYFNRGELKTESGRPADDGWDMGRGGFRLDGNWGTNALTLQGDYYGGAERETITLVDLANPPGYATARTAATTVNGGNILSRWTRTLNEGEAAVQLYYDRKFRDIPQLFRFSYDTVDVDLLHRFNWGGMHETTWGGGYRFVSESFTGTDMLRLSGAHGDQRLYSAFLQDDITLVQEKLHLILGSKFEHNVFTGFEVQPTGRLIWTPSESFSAWGAVSRAVHTPSRGESDNQLRQSAQPNPAGPLFPPIVVTVQGPGNLRSEEVMAYEAGVRMKVSRQVSLDLAGYYNVYRRLIAVQTLAPQMVAGPPAYVEIPNRLANIHNGEGWGGELAADGQVTDPWRLAAAYSYTAVTDTAGERPPPHQLSLRSHLEASRTVELDLWGRYVAACEDYRQSRLPSYVELDARIGWRPLENLELALVGRNLLHERRQEFRPEFIQSQPSAAGREVHGKATWSF